MQSGILKEPAQQMPVVAEPVRPAPSRRPGVAQPRGRPWAALNATPLFPCQALPTGVRVVALREVDGVARPSIPETCPPGEGVLLLVAPRRSAVPRPVPSEGRRAVRGDRPEAARLACRWRRQMAPTGRGAAGAALNK